MKKTILLLTLLIFLIPASYSQEKPSSADEIMQEAMKIAKKEKKDIFLMFHASWCGWCKRMDAAMKDESCKDFFDNNFVTIHMVVKESAANKHLENPGADELLAKYNGDKAGIPFWLIFDRKGKLIADSFKTPGDLRSNIGCPAQDEEIAAFISKLKLAAKMSEAEENSILERFKQNRN